MCGGGQPAAMTQERNLALKLELENASPSSDKACRCLSSHLSVKRPVTPATLDHGSPFSCPHHTKRVARHSPAARGDHRPEITPLVKEP